MPTEAPFLSIDPKVIDKQIADKQIYEIALKNSHMRIGELRGCTKGRLENRVVLC